ncbi:opioid-binding protein/cell adhesion molecule-like isoform X2 [Anopheles albimanus]|uniref:opioid-binding protein/cell adhesion molecule-like isoform X2 n=1 Tax=Anopheles albimanus TaxID=7167 RepID=UPI0016404EEB|nr:opioid-binding protein/cell adhesion molecule-like isoform X2 [Anopheles albimanus]
MDQAQRAVVQMCSIVRVTLVLVVVQVVLGTNRPIVTGNPAAGSFRSVPTTVKTYENETVLLPCYHNAPYRYVRWSRDDLLLVDSRYPDLRAPPRMQLWGNGSLEVRDVQAEDTGDYICEIMTDGGKASQSHAIEVQYEATATIYPEDSIDIRVGQILEVACAVTGVPKPYVTWSYQQQDNASTVFQDDRKLSVLIKDRHFSGPVQCTATNAVGEPATASVEVIVNFVPEIEVKTGTVHTRVGETAILECLVTSHPVASIHWFHHGLPVVFDRRIVKLDAPISKHQYYTVQRHQLAIRNLRDSDLGQYECKAGNRVGITGTQLELTGRPMVATFKPAAEMSSPTTHNFIWQTESFSPIIEYKLKFRRVPSGNVTPARRTFPQLIWNELIIPSDGSYGPLHSIGYTLQGLQPTSVYEVLVLSRNRYGWSDPSNILRFATGGELEIDSGGEDESGPAGSSSSSMSSSVAQTTEGAIEYSEVDPNGVGGEGLLTDNMIPNDYFDHGLAAAASAAGAAAATNHMNLRCVTMDVLLTVGLLLGTFCRIKYL